MVLAGNRFILMEPLSCADAASNSSRPFLFRTASIRPAKSIAAAADSMPMAASHERTVRWNSACAMALGEVRYRVDAATLLHEDFARAVGRGQARYTGFSDDPLDGFRDLATDLVRFGSVFLAGTTPEFAALVTKAERTRPPRGFVALSPGHHPA